MDCNLVELLGRPLGDRGQTKDHRKKKKGGKKNVTNIPHEALVRWDKKCGPWGGGGRVRGWQVDPPTPQGVNLAVQTGSSSVKNNNVQEEIVLFRRLFHLVD